MKTEKQDLTSGSVSKKLIIFALPLFGANLLQSFYSIVDMLVVGQIVGSVGIAAISNASMISFIINSIAIGITMGGAVLISQYKGSDDEQGQKETASTLFTTSFIISIIVTFISLLIYRPIFNLLNLPAVAMQDASQYMQIICAGTIFVFGYNTVASILKGLGDSKSSLYFVAIATVVNIILDLIFVGPMGMGTKGAAYATIISQSVSLLISIIYLKQKSFILDFKLKNFNIKMDKLIKILEVGLPTAIQMVVVNSSYLLITGMLNNFGVSVVAAAGIGLKVNTFAGMPCWAIGQAVTTMVGQNMGAKDIERVEKTLKIGLSINVIVTLFVIILVQIFAENIIMLFDSSNVDVIREGLLYLRISCSVNSLIYASMYTFDSFSIGIGSANIAMLNSLLDAVVVRLPLSWLLAFKFQFGSAGIYIGQALSPILPFIIGLLYFKNKSWKSKKLIIKK